MKNMLSNFFLVPRIEDVLTSCRVLYDHVVGKWIFYVTFGKSSLAYTAFVTRECPFAAAFIRLVNYIFQSHANAKMKQFYLNDMKVDATTAEEFM